MRKVQCLMGGVCSGSSSMAGNSKCVALKMDKQGILNFPALLNDGRPSFKIQFVLERLD